MTTDPLEKVRISKRIEEAQAHQMSGAFAAAAEIYEELLERHPGQAAIMRGIGVLCVQQGLLDDAERWLSQAVESDPEDAHQWNDLGEALRLLGRGEEAVAAYRRALALQPVLTEAMNNLAVVLAGKGELQEAKQFLQQAIEAAPEDPYPYNNLGVVLESEGDLDGALKNYENAVKRKPDFIEARENYASLISRRPDRLMESMSRLLEDAKGLD